MALFHVISNFQYDFVLQLLPVDTGNTIDEVAAAASLHSVGRRVAPRPEKVVRVRRQGAEQFYARKAKLGETDIKPMETLEFIFCDE
ncbi:toluene-4-monooxygenase system B family protein [Paraburkholderia sp. CNPSo 3274]|uniref:Toluene monooxygenase n=1 Tax=Paraburkholderia guartelaensis TaxID=2546446 RepID=A0A4R5L2B0_9BURK|nr:MULTISPECIES: toluene-4-monooxygenase system B family protein [Paraburkholderia]MCP3712498.1 toluene-4-monooxygenase system B family protein [Paraburkholderia sp. CNPSo 3274]MCP3721223.1 toluene-4-monooxygenase system B family protein [Paraburkholderia sp. CNPSo 3281]MCP3728737.1 toluene-4-monooxygenase system B family protein [Paraburkholderia sp. CNPSo 3272]MCX5545859.1 toluene-4-monooxygenase system B family protein [Paraburkholderia sp. CNPSo 3076]TDG02212.1 toluene monooxygenase [Parab